MVQIVTANSTPPNTFIAILGGKKSTLLTQTSIAAILAENNLTEEEATTIMCGADTIYEGLEAIGFPVVDDSVPVPPEWTTIPSITGTTIQGSTLTGVDGVVEGGTITGRQWRRNGNNISGATTNTYVLDTPDIGTQITYRQTATNEAGSVSSVSNPTATITAIPAPVFTVIPSITGSAIVGETLTGSDGTISGGTVSVRQWQRNGTNISGATSSTYVVTEDDLDTTLVFKVTATGAGGTTDGYSNPTDEVGTPAPTFPSGATLLLYGSDASPTSGLWKNRATGLELPANLIGNARPMENPHLSLSGNNVTTTQSVAGVDAALKAVRFQHISGSSPYRRLVERRLAAGTYTLQLDAIDNSGSGSVIRIGGFGSAYLSANKSITGSWATYSHTFTIAAETTVALDVTVGTGAAAFDVSVDNMAIVSGSSPIVVSPTVDLNPAMIPALLGPNKSGNVVETNQATQSNARVGLGLPEIQRSAVSFVAAVRMDPAFNEVLGSIAPLINERESASQELNSTNGLIFGPHGGSYKLSGISSTGTGTSAAGPSKAGWCVLIGTAGATGTDLWVNDVKVATTSTAYQGGTFSALELFGMRNMLNLQFPGKIAMLGMWERKLSPSEVADAYAAAVAQIAAHGETFTNFNTFMIGEGDSITAGSGDSFGGYFNRAGRLHTTRLQGIRYAVAGATMNASPADGANDIGALNRRVAVDAKIAEVIALGKRAIFSVLIGANNSGSFNSDPTPYFDRLKAYTDDRKALGAKIVVQTLTDSNVYTGTQRTNVGIFNQMLRDGVTAGYFDACADHAATAMGTWSGTNFGDDVHPNVAGHTLMAATLQAAVAPLVI